MKRMKPVESRSRRVRRSGARMESRKRAGLTLLELMASMVIMTIAMLVVFQAFSGTIRGWRRGTEVAEGIKHGEFVMTKIAAAINSTIYFFNSRMIYDFTIEKDTYNGLPADTVSLVTSSSAFVPENSPLRHTPHRITFYIDDDESGRPALYALTFPAVANIQEGMEEFDAEPYLVARAVQGLDVSVYDQQQEDWSTEDWIALNRIPDMILLTVYVGSDNEEEEPIAFTRVIEIPVALAANRVRLGSRTQLPQGNRK